MGRSTGVVSVEFGALLCWAVAAAPERPEIGAGGGGWDASPMAESPTKPRPWKPEGCSRQVLWLLLLKGLKGLP